MQLYFVCGVVIVVLGASGCVADVPRSFESAESELSQAMRRPNSGVACGGWCNQYRGPGDTVPPNFPGYPPGTHCTEVAERPAACDLAYPSDPIGCGFPLPAIEISVRPDWVDAPFGVSWDCIHHPEGFFQASVTAGEVFDACDAARADTSLSAPMVDFVVDFGVAEVGAFYTYPHAGLRQYCVTHWSHQGPDVSECGTGLNTALTHRVDAHGQWPEEHKAVERLNNINVDFGFETDPCQGDPNCYRTWNNHCATDINGWRRGPNIGGGRIRFNCDCQETVIRQIIEDNPDTWDENTPVYWFAGI